MRPFGLATFVSIVPLLVAAAASARPDTKVIAEITGRAAEAQGEVVRVSVPRTDLAVKVDGISMSPFQGFTSWAAFQDAGEQTMVMGDVVLTEDQANRTLDAALGAGLEVTALHNHFFHEEPRVVFMHVYGMGSTEALARGVKATLDAVDAASPSVARGAGPAKTQLPLPSRLEAKPLEAILDAPAQAKDGMVKFVLGRPATMNGTTIGAALGVNTWAVFAGQPVDAVVDGDFVMLEGELQGVLKALRRSGIEIVAIHNHMTHESPRLLFLHYWGRGPVDDLARGVKGALDTQAR